eukprot:427479_1
MAKAFELHCKRCSESNVWNGPFCNDTDIVFYDSHLLLRSDLKTQFIEEALIQHKGTKSKHVPYYYECRKCKNKVANAILPDQNTPNSLQIALNVRDFNFIDITTNNVLLPVFTFLQKKSKKFKLKPKHLKSLQGFDHIECITFRDIMSDLTANIKDNKDIMIPSMNKQANNDVYNESLQCENILKLTRTVPLDHQIELFILSIHYQNAIICLPTGFGKTLIACLLFKYYHTLYSMHKFGVFVVNRIPLVFQQSQYIQKETKLKYVKGICGENVDMKEALSFNKDNVHVLVITAQIFWNMLETGQFSMKRCHTLIFDEIHNGVSENSVYAKIVKKYVSQMQSNNDKPYIIGLTASPGEKEKKIIKLCSNFGCRLLKPKLYQNQIENSIMQTKWRIIQLNQYEMNVNRQFQTYIQTIGNFIKLDYRQLSKLHINDISHPSIARLFDDICDSKQYSSAQQQLASHALSVLNLKSSLNIIGFTQSEFDVVLNELNGWETNNFQQKLKMLFDQMVKSCSKLIDSSRYKKLCEIVDKLRSKYNNEFRGIIFVKTRKTARHLIDKIKTNKCFYSLRPLMIVGHNDFDGMNWFEHQRPILQRFRNGNVKLLIATSVLEEGLDVSECNIVIRFNAPQSLISHIQGRGRARCRKNGDYIIIAEQGEKERLTTLIDKEKKINEIITNIQRNQTHFIYNSNINGRIRKIIDNKKQIIRKKKHIIINDETKISDDHSILNVYHLTLYAININQNIEEKESSDFLQHAIYQFLYENIGYLDNISVKLQSESALNYKKFMVAASNYSNPIQELNVFDDIISSEKIQLAQHQIMIEWLGGVGATNYNNKPSLLMKSEISVKRIEIGYLNSFLSFIAKETKIDGESMVFDKSSFILTYYQTYTTIEFIKTFLRVDINDRFDHNGNSYYIPKEIIQCIQLWYGVSGCIYKQHYWFRFPYSIILQKRIIVHKISNNKIKLLFSTTHSPYFGIIEREKYFREPYSNATYYFSFSVTINGNLANICKLMRKFHKFDIKMLFANFDTQNDIYLNSMHKKKNTTSHFSYLIHKNSIHIKSNTNK